MQSDEEAIECILDAIKEAGYEPEKDFRIAIDVAASEWKSDQRDVSASKIRGEIFLRGVDRALEVISGTIP